MAVYLGKQPTCSSVRRGECVKSAAWSKAEGGKALAGLLTQRGGKAPPRFPAGSSLGVNGQGPQVRHLNAGSKRSADP
jgi:hypothetical protein